MSSIKSKTDYSNKISGFKMVFKNDYKAFVDKTSKISIGFPDKCVYVTCLD